MLCSLIHSTTVLLLVAELDFYTSRGLKPTRAQGTFSAFRFRLLSARACKRCYSLAKRARHPAGFLAIPPIQSLGKYDCRITRGSCCSAPSGRQNQFGAASAFLRRCPFLFEPSLRVVCFEPGPANEVACSAASLLYPQHRVARVSRLIGKSDTTLKPLPWQVAFRGRSCFAT